MNDRPLFIKNARIVKGCGTPIIDGAVLVTYENGDGIISGMGDIPAERGCRVLDAGGAYILPAFTDIGCRFFDSEYPSRESVMSASAAAVGGGFASIVCEPCENGDTVSNAVISDARCTLIPSHFADGKEKATKEKNAVCSDGGKWIEDSLKMREIMLACHESDSLLISSATDMRLVGCGSVSEGKTAKMLGLTSIPASAETSAVARDIMLAAETGCRLHIRAISSADSVELVRFAKKTGANITCGTSPLYFSMTDKDVFYYGSNAKVLPTLKTKNDVNTIREALLDGTIDCISSLHTPLTRDENCSDISRCRFGATGLDTAFPAFVTYMMKNGFCEIDDAARLLSVRPSEILGFDSRLYVGGKASFTVADTETELVISSNSLKSKAVNTPYLGATLNGSIRAVFIGGTRL